MERKILHVDVNNAFLSWSAIDMLKNGETLAYIHLANSEDIENKVEKLKSFIDDCSKLAGQVDDEMESLGKFETAKDKGMYILNTIVPLADALRAKADSMERYISKENQPYPTYEELFFAIDYDK